MIKKLASHLGEYKRAAILTPMFSALEAVMDILLPTIMAFIIDLGIEKGDMNAIVKYGLLTFAVAAIALLLGILAGKYAAEASTGFAGNLRDAMYENIQHYSFSNIDKFSTAGLVTRMTTDVTNLQNAFQMMERMCVRARSIWCSHSSWRSASAVLWPSSSWWPSPFCWPCWQASWSPPSKFLTVFSRITTT